MTVRTTNGVTLVELIVTVTIMAFISAAAAALFGVCLQAYDAGTRRSDLLQEGALAMERMSASVRPCTSS